MVYFVERWTIKLKLPLISIIVPIYNVGKYVHQCIDSIERQTYSNIQIVLVDDGSTDESAQICDEHARKDKRIKVIHKKNGGLVSARKTGIKEATGELIGYVDGDDWIEPNMYEKLYQKMQQENVDIVMCGRYENTLYKEKKVYQSYSEGKYNKEDMKLKIYPRMIVNELFFEWGITPTLWDKLFKKECILPYQLEVDHRIVWGEDAACTYPCLLNVSSIYIIQECLYHYRQTPSSMSKSIPNAEEEKQKYQILYHYTLDKFEKYKNIYDLKEQWIKYILFLMVARSDTLYYKYEKIKYLFPFKNVKKGEKIILYGAGTYGRRLYSYLQRTGFCKVIKWVDQDYCNLRREGLNVWAIDCIEQNEYDHIIVAITYAKARREAVRELRKKFGYDKVEDINTDLIFSEESKKAFGLK